MFKQKHCSSCLQFKDISEFALNNTKRDGLQSYCKPCKSQRDAVFYKKNKRAHLARVKIYLENNKIKIWNYLKKHPCVDCKESNPVVLEFDHVRGKKVQSVIYILHHTKCSWRTLYKEIRKCEIRCANCHRIKTAKELNWHKYMGR